jgi:hypothetical protein
MKYAVGMGSSAMIHIPSFIKIGSGIQKLVGVEGDSQQHRQHGDCLSLLFFFQNKESRLKMEQCMRASAFPPYLYLLFIVLIIHNMSHI